MNCPKCGSNKGWYTTGLFYQYYDANGEPNGCHTDNFESAMAKCIKCNKRIKLSSILTPPNNKRQYRRKCGVCNAPHEQKEMIRTDKSPNGWMCYECYNMEEDYDLQV